MTGQARLYRSTHQCSTCPWRRAVDPQNLGEDFGHVDPDKLGQKGASGLATLSVIEGMACHRSPEDDPFACVGWVCWGLGPGQHFGLRLHAIRGVFDAGALVLNGPQRLSFGEIFGDNAAPPRRRR